MSSQKFLRQIEQESILTRNRLIVEAIKRGKNISQSGELVPSLKHNMKVAKKEGIPFKVRFGFKVRGMYIAAGVGRGTSVAQALANQSNREKVDWYKPVIAAQLPKFIDLWLNYWADKLMEEAQQDLNSLGDI